MPFIAQYCPKCMSGYAGSVPHVCPPKSAAPTIDTEHKDAPVCPHCGQFNDASWRVGNKYGLCRDECRSCGREFIVTRHVTVTYSTRKP